MNKTILTLFLIATVEIALGQSLSGMRGRDQIPNVSQFNMFTSGSGGSGNMNISLPANTDGTGVTENLNRTPYLTEEPLKAVIYLEETRNVLPEAKFNMRRNAVEKLQGGTTVMEYTPEHIQGFLLYQEDELYKAFVAAQPFGFAEPVFMEVVSQGEQPLLVFRKLIYQYGDEHAAYNTGFTSDVIVMEKFYTETADGYSRVMDRRSAILWALRDRRQEVKAYAKANRLSFDKVEDVALIFDYYNELVESTKDL